MDLDERTNEATRLREVAKRLRSIASERDEKATRLESLPNGRMSVKTGIAWRRKLVNTLNTQADELDELAGQYARDEIE